jgi:large subunit ribosomal protein LX
MKAYRIKGKFLMGDKMSPFSREIEAEDEKDAYEKMVSLIGSEHRCKRNRIKVEGINEVPFDEIEDIFVKARIEGA